MFELSQLSGNELVALASIISVAISQNLNATETNALGNFFEAVGTNLTIIAESK